MSEFNFKNPYSSENLALEFRKKQDLKSILEVNPQEGPFYKIQEAIDNAPPFSHIIVNQGVYKENLRIEIPNLYIEAKNQDSQVIILGQNGPTIFLNIDQGTSLNIHGIQICNRGLNIDEQKYNFSNDQFYRMINDNIFQTVNLVENLSNINQMEVMVYLKQGTLFLSKCNLTLNIFFKQNSQFLCSIYQDKETKCIINECKFKGSKVYPSTGIVCNKGNSSIKNSIFSNHKGSGIFMTYNSQNFCSIFQCVFQKNLFGVFTSGYNNCSKIQDCEFLNNRIGIYLTLQSNITVEKCTIYKNYLGISIINSENIIKENQIILNTSHGIQVHSDEDLISESQIYQNEISYNHENGIFCTGNNNVSRIKYNKIKYNRAQGIKIQNDANIVICKNKIKFNLKEGIKICFNASAFIQENLIANNLQANIAVGSSDKKDTVILKNQIINGRCQGIFILCNFKARIMNNFISGNNEAILCVNSSPILSKNIIEQNHNIGLLAIKKNVLNLLENIFKSNTGPGIFVKDDFDGNFIDNKLKKNNIDFIIENKKKGINDLISDNEIHGEKRYSGISICKIFQIIKKINYVQLQIALIMDKAQDYQQLKNDLIIVLIFVFLVILQSIYWFQQPNFLFLLDALMQYYLVLDLIIKYFLYSESNNIKINKRKIKIYLLFQLSNNLLFIIFGFQILIKSCQIESLYQISSFQCLFVFVQNIYLIFAYFKLEKQIPSPLIYKQVIIEYPDKQIYEEFMELKFLINLFCFILDKVNFDHEIYQSFQKSLIIIVGINFIINMVKEVSNINRKLNLTLPRGFLKRV